MILNSYNNPVDNQFAIFLAPGIGLVEDNFPTNGVRVGRKGRDSGGNARDGEQWGAADGVSLTCLTLTSCCVAWFLTGLRLVPVWDLCVGDPWDWGCNSRRLDMFQKLHNWACASNIYGFRWKWLYSWEKYYFLNLTAIQFIIKFIALCMFIWDSWAPCSPFFPSLVQS